MPNAQTPYPNGWLGGEIPYPPIHAWRRLAAPELKKAWSACDTSAGIGLYLHLPPMVSLRTDSPFDPPLPYREKQINLYLDCLEKEADLLGLPAGLPVRTVYIGSGGLGVLSTFPEVELARLLRLITKRFNLKPCLQFMAEIRPTGLAAAQARLLKRYGINRVTMMIPDLARYPEQFTRLPADIEQTCRLCRRHGITGIDVDLSLGESAPSRECFKNTLAAVLALKPDSVHIASSFGDVSAKSGADRERHDFLDKVRSDIRAVLPRPDDDRPHRENIQLAHARIFGGSVLGLGFGAVSHAFARVKHMKAGTYSDYINSLDQGRLPPILGCILDVETEMRGYLAGQFEDVGWLDLATFQNVFHRKLSPKFLRTVTALLSRGLLERQGSVVRVPPRYRAKRFEIAGLFHAPGLRQPKGQG